MSRLPQLWHILSTMPTVSFVFSTGIQPLSKSGHRGEFMLRRPGKFRSLQGRPRFSFFGPVEHPIGRLSIGRIATYSSIVNLLARH
jgi:hypothetical protein